MVVVVRIYFLIIVAFSSNEVSLDLEHLMTVFSLMIHRMIVVVLFD
jgi:hypothetical protein